MIVTRLMCSWSGSIQISVESKREGNSLRQTAAVDMLGILPVLQRLTSSYIQCEGQEPLLISKRGIRKRKSRIYFSFRRNESFFMRKDQHRRDMGTQGEGRTWRGVKGTLCRKATVSTFGNWMVPLSILAEKTDVDKRFVDLLLGE